KLPKEEEKEIPDLRNLEEVVELVEGAAWRGIKEQKYIVIEPPPLDEEVIQRAKDYVLSRISFDDLDKLQKIYEWGAQKALKEFKKKYDEKTLKSLIYYLKRDIEGLGKLEPIMRDPYVEDVTLPARGGRKLFVYLAGRGEWLETNIELSEEEARQIVLKLAERAGKQVSLAVPRLEGKLPDGSRVHALYGPAVSEGGTTFTIRKFVVRPRIEQLISWGSVSIEAAAYLWLLAEHGVSGFIVGETGSGKSLVYDEQVLIWREREGYSLIEIGKLAERLAIDGLIEERDGIRIIKPSGKILVPSFDQNYKIDLHELTSVVVHKAPEEIYEVITRSGRRVRVTGDHSVFTVRGARILPVPVRDLKRGDVIVIPRKIPLSPIREEKLNLIELFMNSGESTRLYIRGRIVSEILSEALDELGIRKLCEVTGLRRRSVYQIKKNGVIRLDLFHKILKELGRSIPSEDLNEVRIGSKTNGKLAIPALIPINRDLARFIGYWLAEGRFDGSYTLIYSSNEEIRQEIREISRRLFKIHPNEISSDPLRLILPSPVTRFLKALGLKSGCKNKNLPSIVQFMNKELIEELLSAYIDGDGFLDHKRGQVEISTKSKSLVNSILYLLLTLGVVGRLQERKLSSELCYRIIIPRSELKNFRNVLSRCIRRSIREGLEKIGFNVKLHAVDLLPDGAGLCLRRMRKRHIRSSRELGFLYHTLKSYENGRRRLSRQKLAQFLLALEKAAPSIREDPTFLALKKLIESDLFFDEVIEIRRIKYEGEFVYDLEVQGTENFVGGFGGIILHNTTFLNALLSLLPKYAHIVTVEDSVTGDCEIIFVKDGRVLRGKIGELIDEELRKRGMEEGALFVRDSDIKVYAIDERGRVILAPVTMFYKHRVFKDIYEVRTSTGRTIRTTGDHSLFTIDDRGRIVPIEVRNISAGDYIVVPRYLPPLNMSSEEIDLLSRRYIRSLLELQEKTGRELYVKGSGIKQILESLPRDLRLKFDKTGYRTRKGVLPLSEFIKISEKVKSLKGDLYIGTRNSRAIPSKIPLNESFMEFFGLWLADGSYNADRSVIISCRDAKCVWDVSKHLRTKVGVHSDGMSLMLNSVVFRTIMEHILGFSGDVHTKRVPEWIFSLNERQISAFLRGYFSGDGNVGRYEIESVSTSYNLLKDIQMLLLRLGIVSRIKETRKRGGCDKEPMRYRISISDRGNLKTFKDKVGFLQEEKNRKLSSMFLTEDISRETLPVGIEELSRKLKLNWRQKSSLGYSYTHKTGRTTKSKLKRMLVMADGGDIHLQRLRERIEDDLYLDKVVSIKKISDGGEGVFVYDLTVGDYENFICEGIVAHNTPEIYLPEHRNWTSLIGQPPGMGVKGMEIPDLLRDVLRMRPDYVVVGESRGAEVRLLVQFIHIGHTSFTTFHASTIEGVIARLKGDPINLTEEQIADFKVAALLRKEGNFRGVVRIAELSYDSTKDEVVLRDIFTRRRGRELLGDPIKSSQIFIEIAAKEGVPRTMIVREYLDKIDELRRRVEKARKGTS
ncbi:MAG: hypothetical protein DRO05_02910, partial [Thermoproteota archaeon]